MLLDSAIWELIPSCQVSFCAGTAVIVYLMLWRLFFRNGRRYEVPARDISKGHHWFMIDILSHTVHCSICELLIVEGWYCDSCGICADNICLRAADKTLHCKSLSGTGSLMKHHWIKGNLHAGAVCEHCKKTCESLCNDDEEDAGLGGYRCCWCQRSVHTSCLPQPSEECDLGPFKSFIVPPYCVRLKLVGWKGRRHFVVSEVKSAPYKPWHPLIVIANRQSGNNDGDLILRAFRSILNPAQVIDLHDLPPESGLEWCHLVCKTTFQVLVAGGDGTVGWVLAAIEKLKLEPKPHVGILPLGTGNDLSRVLGWGEGYSANDVSVKSILRKIASSEAVLLDRWKLQVVFPRHIGIRKPSKEFFMSNYASVGVDALVALNFHKTRKSKFYLFSSRLLNKFLYFGYGTKEFLERQCKNLHEKIDLYIDDRRIELPEVEGIVVLNINSWGAGVKLWSTESDNTQWAPQRFNDGLVEVIGLYSTFHIAQLQIGLSEPIKFGQGSKVKICLKARLPFQVDGEPWEQAPSVITFSRYDQATMLRSRDS